jgi:hypothetical protein
VAERLDLDGPLRLGCLEVMPPGAAARRRPRAGCVRIGLRSIACSSMTCAVLRRDPYFFVAANVPFPRTSWNLWDPTPGEGADHVRSARRRSTRQKMMKSERALNIGASVWAGPCKGSFLPRQVSGLSTAKEKPRSGGVFL